MPAKFIVATTRPWSWIGVTACRIAITETSTNCPKVPNRKLIATSMLMVTTLDGR